MSRPPLAPFAQALGPAPRRSTPPRALRVRWGWLEWFLVALTMVPAVVFVPGTTPIRPLVRIASFLTSIIAWCVISQKARKKAGASSFEANNLLKLAAGWLILSILNPSANSPLSAVATACFYIAVFLPSFWAPAVLISPKQVERLMAILLVCNGLSALVGLGQVFRPSVFNPPVINFTKLGQTDKLSGKNLGQMIAEYQDASGNTITRPCGLTDSPGGAAPAGATAAMIGLAFALRPMGLVKRGLCLVFAFAGVAVIYYSQIRMTMMLVVICVGVLVLIFAKQGNYQHATRLGGLGALLVVGALFVVATTSGWHVVERFVGLASDSFGESYKKSGRQDHLVHALTSQIFEYPFGAGFGWWGVINDVFGDHSRSSSIWVEVMVPAWVVDGGIPLLCLYVGAIGLALRASYRIATRSKDRDLAFWSAVVLASNLSVVATCFSYVSFLTSIGTQFWLLAAVVHAADVRNKETAATATATASASARPRPAPGPPSMPPPPWGPPSPSTPRMA